MKIIQNSNYKNLFLLNLLILSMTPISASKIQEEPKISMKQKLYKDFLSLPLEESKKEDLSFGSQNSTKLSLLNSSTQEIKLKKEPETDFMSKLPNEIYVGILSYLPVKDLLSLCSISSRFSELAGSEAVWDPLIHPIKGDYDFTALRNKSSAEIYKLHALKVYLSTLDSNKDQSTIKYISKKYPLYKLSNQFFYDPFSFPDPGLLMTDIEKPDIKDRDIESLTPDFVILPDFLKSQQATDFYRGEALRSIKLGTPDAIQNGHNIIDYLCACGDEKAAEIKIWQGIGGGKYGYEKSEAQLKIVLEEGYNHGHGWAAKLIAVFYTYNSSPQEIKGVQAGLEAHSAASHPGALEAKIEGLIYGRYGYAQNLIQARQLIEEGVIRGHQKVIEKKITGLIQGVFGYEKDLTAACNFIKSLPLEQAIIGINKNLITPNGQINHEFIDALYTNNYRYGFYLKALSLKYDSRLSPEQREESKYFILQHKIAFKLRLRDTLNSNF